jgi:hypothetical protein
VADYSPDDLSREIDRLWARVGSAGPAPSSASEISASSPAATTAGADVAWETVALLKRQHRQSENSWRQTMEARDEAVRILRLQLEKAEEELSRLRIRAEGEEERLVVDTLDAREKIETAQKAIKFAEERHAQERSVLEAALQSLRERVAAETSRARASEMRWQEREQQYLLDLKELQALAARRDKEVGESGKTSRALEASLAEAKNALEKTFAELLLERKERERATSERETAVKKVDELRAHVDELSKIWDEERAQWRELWDRERSTWETQRVELGTWEENLRREREAWHAELQAKEKAHLALTEDLSGKIRETSQNAEKMADLIQTFEKGEHATSSAESALRAAAIINARQAKIWGFVKTVAFAGVLVAAGLPAWRYATALRFVVESTSPAPTQTPTALAFDGSLIWMSDWNGKLLTIDPASPRRVVSTWAPAPGGPYRPTALAVGGGALWSLDAAQARLLRHSTAGPERILAARPSPGAAPTAIAFDGQTVWTYDAADRTLTRHGGDDAPVQAYSLPDEAVPNAMAWSGDYLWISDAKGRRLLIYKVEGKSLVRAAVEPFPEPGVVGLALSGSGRERRLYLLLAPSGARAAAELVRYRLKSLLPFAEF